MKVWGKACLLLAGLAASTVQAGAIASGDWSTLHTAEFSEASTLSPQGDRLGFFCNASERLCYFYLNLKADCPVKTKQTALLSAGEASRPIDLVCIEVDGEPVLIFADADTIERLIRSTSTVGFSVPLEGGRFHQSTYSVRGAGPAIDEARRLKGGEKYDPASEAFLDDPDDY